MDPVRYNHVWLYARGRYHNTHDVLTDIRIIHAYGHDMVDVVDHITDAFILDSMLELVEQYVTSTVEKVRLFKSIVGPLVGTPLFDVPISADTSRSIDRMLFVLSSFLQVLQTVSERERFYLGDTDPELEKLLKASRDPFSKAIIDIDASLFQIEEHQIEIDKLKKLIKADR